MSLFDPKSLTKGGLISEGILTLVPLPTKVAKSLLSRKIEFLPITVDDLVFKFSAQERDLALFVSNGTKVKIFSEIKPPLGEYVSQIFFCFFSFLEFALLQSFTTDLLSSRELKSIPTPKFH